MTAKLECFECNRIVTPVIEERRETLPVKGEPTEVLARVGVCPQCGADMSVPELDEATLVTAFNIYRQRHSLMTSEEMRGLRERYGLGQRPFSLLLGWGEITLHRYESGSLQDTAHDAQLKMAEDPANMRILLQANGHKLSSRQRTRLEASLRALDEVRQVAFLVREEPNVYGSAAQSDLAADLARLRSLSGIKWARYPADVLPAWVADMDLPTAPPVIDAVRGLVDRADFGYNFHAQAALPGALAQWTAERHGWRPDTKRMRVLTDVLQAVDLALWLGTKPGDGVVLFTPVYPPFISGVTTTGRRIIDCPLTPDGWRIDPERLEAVIDSTTTAILMCNPHNPTGRVFDAEELAAIADVAERHNLLVISDEIWADVVYPGAKHIPFASLSAATEARTVTVFAASKAFNLAGLRCAVAHIGVEALEAQVKELPAHLLGGVSSPGAVATLTAWTEGAPWQGETVAFLEQQRDHVIARFAAELPEARLSTPEATYLAWVDLRAFDLGDDPAAWLLEHAKVALGSGPDFGEHGKGFARLNFATTRPVLDEVIDRVVGALG